jgi:hypothetical protein
MYLIIILSALMLSALLVVSLLNHLQQKEAKRRLEQRRLRLHYDHLHDIVSCLENLLPEPLIIKHINDLAIDYLKAILALETTNRIHIENAILKARAHSERLSSKQEPRITNFACDSDAQILNAQTHIKEAIDILPQLVTQRKVPENGLDEFSKQLQWALLMVPVRSYMTQGDKAQKISDRVTATAYYRKAQQLLMESLLQNPQRITLIKELGYLIEGSRDSLPPTYST